MIRLGRYGCAVSHRAILATVLTLALAAAVPAARGVDDPPADSPMVKLLKSGRVPEERQGAVIEMIGKRGTAADLHYIYQKALDGSPAPLRVKALEALAEAAWTRGLKPEKDREKLVGLLAGPEGGPLRGPAIRLAGAWKLEAASEPLRQIARSPKVDGGTRESAIDALAAIGGKAGRAAIEDLAGPGQAVAIRMSAVAALTRLDLAAAAARAAELIPVAVAEGGELQSLMVAFLNHKGGGAALAAAIERHKIPADAAKAALRSVLALSQADPALAAALGRDAGISTEARPLLTAELASLVAEVGAKGDPARGESVFRRADLNCLTCHSVSKAGGDIGPDLSSIGQTSPPDYIIQSILLPDQSIKEQYHTLVVQTADGLVYQGIVTDKDDRRIVLKESTGALRTVPVDAIEDQKAGGSLMPKGLANLMTHAEFVDLVRFLSELGRPGPYAIRTTPTIQRWRVLKAVPPRLAEAVPDAETLRDQVLHLPPDRWGTVYARVSGSLPLDEAVRSAGGGPVLYLQGELDVTALGTIRICPAFPEAIRFWVDDVAAPIGTREFATSVTPGRHAVTLRVENAERMHREIRMTVDKPSGSTAEFTVVGGK